MADNRKVVKIKEDNLGDVHVADEVVAIIAGLAATEVEGVASMAGNITNELVSKLGMKNLSKGVKVEVAEKTVSVEVALNISYGYSIPEVSEKVQEKVKSAIETMTGLSVAIVNVRIATVDMKNFCDNRRCSIIKNAVKAFFFIVTWKTNIERIQHEQEKNQRTDI